MRVKEAEKKKMNVLTRDPGSQAAKNKLSKDFKLVMLADWGEDILRLFAGGIRTAELSTASNN